MLEKLRQRREEIERGERPLMTPGARKISALSFGLPLVGLGLLLIIAIVGFLVRSL